MPRVPSAGVHARVSVDARTAGSVLAPGSTLPLGLPTACVGQRPWVDNRRSAHLRGRDERCADAARRRRPDCRESTERSRVCRGRLRRRRAVGRNGGRRRPQRRRAEGRGQHLCGHLSCLRFESGAAGRQPHAGAERLHQEPQQGRLQLGEQHRARRPDPAEQNLVLRSVQADPGQHLRHRQLPARWPAIRHRRPRQPERDAASDVSNVAATQAPAGRQQRHDCDGALGRDRAGLSRGQPLSQDPVELQHDGQGVVGAEQPVDVRGGTVAGGDDLSVSSPAGGRSIRRRQARREHRPDHDGLHQSDSGTSTRSGTQPRTSTTSPDHMRSRRA